MPAPNPAADPPAKQVADDGPVILFDGVCNLCAGVVRFVIAREAAPRFRFASLQSESARALLAARSPPHGALPDSIVLIDRDGLHTRSDAALRIARSLRAPWRYAAALAVIPRPLRDAIYALVAALRYRVFGRRDSCLVPTPDLAARFISDEPTDAPTRDASSPRAPKPDT